MLSWSEQFNIFCFMDNMGYKNDSPAFDFMLAAGASDKITADAGNALDSLARFVKDNNDWIFGHLSYDLKNEIEELSSTKFDSIGFPDLQFFIPEILIQCYNDRIDIGSLTIDPELVFDVINNHQITGKSQPARIKILQRFSKAEYLETIQSIRDNILRGDCYELTFCQEFYAENVEVNPLDLFEKLVAISPNPFTAFYKSESKYLLCASPERYIRKKGNKLISQPIKGTSLRDPESELRDQLSKSKLRDSEKDRAENVMIVDLVRNDLSRICLKGSVKVDELFGIYTFPQVHQMISTVSGTIDETISLPDVIRATFPMGSMTGAPKKRVMELIEEYERSKRGLFSGSVGYIEPNGDFDFNVVIRSIQYNSLDKFLSFMVGSAITFYSDAEKEYEECLWKASAMMKVLE